jgi:hypothetical protein
MPNGDHYSPPVPALHAGIFRQAGVRIFTRILTDTTGNAITQNLILCATNVNRFLRTSTNFSMSTREQSQPPPVLILEHPATNFRASNDLALNYNIKDEAASWSLPTGRR